MFDTIVSIGIIALQAAILVTIIAWIVKAPLASWVARNSNWILRAIFVAAVAGSIIYAEFLGFEPCVLCWYQRMAIFPLAILLFTADIAKNALLRLQTLILASAGFAVALFHNVITIFPSAEAACGLGEASCTVLYVFQFGYITIPMMSATVLLAGLIVALLAGRYPQGRGGTAAA